MRAPNDEDEAAEDDEADRQRRERERMARVRSLQEAFYSPSAGGSDDEAGNPSENPSAADRGGAAHVGGDGLVRHLPLWRVPSTELPGRQMVLFLDDAQHTHMFETVLRGGGKGASSSSSPPRYVGQLYTPGSPDEVRGTSLRGWEDLAAAAASEEVGGAPAEDASGGDARQPAVVGTLLRIADHRRMDDGRLVLLVQALERFVVVRPRKERPFPVADVQILPDEEEMMALVPGWGEEVGGGTQQQQQTPSRQLRTRAIHESFWRWHPYEYDADVRLTIGDDDNGFITGADIVGGDLARLLPFIPYSSTVDPKGILAHDPVEREEAGASLGNVDCGAVARDGTDSSLETKLILGGILREVPSLTLARALGNRSLEADDLEVAVWICIDEHIRAKRVRSVAPPELLCLLPSGREWPESFALEFIAEELAKNSGKDDPPFVRVGEDYPAHRRQRRLSYSATGLLAGKMLTSEILNRSVRQTLLEIPSTRGRLWAVLERFEYYNAQFKDG